MFLGFLEKYRKGQKLDSGWTLGPDNSLDNGLTTRAKEVLWNKWNGDSIVNDCNNSYKHRTAT